MPRGDEPESSPYGDLPVDHCEVLVDVGRAIESFVDVLEDLRRDLPEDFELVVRPEQERLMQHGGDHRVGHSMSRNIGHQNARSIPASAELPHNDVVTLTLCILYTGAQVEAFVEVDVQDVIAADPAPQRHGEPMDVHAR